jgi:hypothetical protein
MAARKTRPPYYGGIAALHSLLDDLHPAVQPPCSSKRSFIRRWWKLKPRYTSVQMPVSPWPD